MEILDVNVLVGSRLTLAPEQQALFGRHLFDRNVLNGETQNDGPNHTQRHLGVAVNDFYLKKTKTKQQQTNIKRLILYLKINKTYPQLRWKRV